MPNEVRSSLIQYDFIRAIVEDHLNNPSQKFWLTANLILQIHTSGLPTNDTAIAPGFRSVEVHIANSSYTPPANAEIEALLDEMCDYVNSSWDDTELTHLPAYVLWRINWIHPFSDGNGRTARAVCYLLLNLKAGFLLPGWRIVPEFLREYRSDYYNALHQADRSFNENGCDSVDELENLLENLLILQLEGSPASGEITRNRIEEIVYDRIRSADPEFLQDAFDLSDINTRIWAFDDVLVVQVGTKADIEWAAKQNLACGIPFPMLVAIGGATAAESVDAVRSGTIMRKRVYSAHRGYALAFDPGASAVVEAPKVIISTREGASGRNLTLGAHV